MSRLQLKTIYIKKGRSQTQKKGAINSPQQSDGIDIKIIYSYFKAAIIKVLQLVIIHVLEKIERLNKEMKVIKMNQMKIFDRRNNKT